MKSMNKQFISVIVGLVLSGAIPFAHAHDNSAAATSVPHLTITFDSNSSLLSDNDKAALHSLTANMKTGDIVNQIVVAAWSDKSLPSQGQKLLAVDRELASDRASAITDYLRESANVTAAIKTYNMAENSNWIARTFRTSDAELKSTFSKKGSKMPVTNAEFKVIKDEGGPSEAVVVLDINPSY